MMEDLIEEDDFDIGDKVCVEMFDLDEEIDDTISEFITVKKEWKYVEDCGVKGFEEVKK